jgi:hypothetical protein
MYSGARSTRPTMNITTSIKTYLIGRIVRRIYSPEETSLTMMTLLLYRWYPSTMYILVIDGCISNITSPSLTTITPLHHCAYPLTVYIQSVHMYTMIMTPVCNS